MAEEFAHDERCHAYRCDALGVNLIIVEGGGGSLGKLCDEHLELEARHWERNARDNLMREQEAQRG